jgi:hypothetical protein
MTELNTEPERSGSLHAYFWLIDELINSDSNITEELNN